MTKITTPNIVITILAIISFFQPIATLASSPTIKSQPKVKNCRKLSALVARVRERRQSRGIDYSVID
jgi:hypothetical protein